MNSTRRQALASLAALMLAPARAALARQAQIVTGTRTGASSVRLAVPPFASGVGIASDVATAFNETLWADLQFSGVITLVNRTFYPLGSFGDPFDITPAEWTDPVVAAQFLAFGNLGNEGGRLAIEARLWDLETRIEDRETEGLRFGGQPTTQDARAIAHQLADRIILLLGGGIRGVSQTKIAFASDRNHSGGGAVTKEIFVMDYDGQNQYQLTTLHSLALTPAWSPDGERIGFTSWGRGTTNVEIISPVDRRGFPFPDFEGTTTTPVWSPDGDQIAFASSHERVRNTPDMELFVASSDGRNVRRLTNFKGVDISPTWNPPGDQIAFSSDRSRSAQIYIIDARGGNERQIVSGGGTAVNPAWSPDGQTIAFAWQQRGERRFELFLHDLASGRNVQLTQNAGDNERPTWSPDGRHIAFQSNRRGGTQIYSMLADGTSVRRLTSNGKNEGPAWSGYMGQ